jgi:hypothetical protein
MERPAWLALLAPLPDDAVVERKAVASAQQIADGTAGPIAGWQSISVNLSSPRAGSRNILITVDASGTLLSGGDHVLFVTPPADAASPAIYDHESVGGRFEVDGSFRGTRWRTRTEQMPDADDDGTTTLSEPSAPTEQEIAALRSLIAEVMRRPHNAVTR